MMELRILWAQIVLGAGALMTASCGFRSSDGAVSTCEDVIAMGERYPSTIERVEASTRASQRSPDHLVGELYGSPVVAQYLKLSLADLVKASASAEPATLGPQSEFPEEGAESASLLRAVMERVQVAPTPGVLEVRISYDMDNGNGVPERHQGSCKFLLSDTKSEAPLIPYDAALALEKSRQQKFGPVQFPNKGFKCCVPQFVLASVDLRTGQRIPTKVRMYDHVEAEVERAHMMSGNR